MKAKTILIADDDVELVALLKLRCESIGLQTLIAHNAIDALHLATQCHPDFICLDVEMPAGNGLSVCEMICENDDQPSVPVIVLTGKTDEEIIRRCFQMGVYYVLKDTETWNRLSPLLMELLDSERNTAVHGDAKNLDDSGATPALATPPTPDQEAETRESKSQSSEQESTTIDEILQSLRALYQAKVDLDGPIETSENIPIPDTSSVPWVLCIDDDVDFGWTLKMRLQHLGVKVVRAFDGTQGYRTAYAAPPDLILLDFEMPNGQGDYVLRRLKEAPFTKDIPVIIITGRKDKWLERTLLNMGAEKYMTKPLDIPELIREVKRHVDVRVPFQNVKS